MTTHHSSKQSLRFFTWQSKKQVQGVCYFYAELSPACCMPPCSCGRPSRLSCTRLHWCGAQHRLSVPCSGRQPLLSRSWCHPASSRLSRLSGESSVKMGHGTSAEDDTSVSQSRNQALRHYANQPARPLRQRPNFMSMSSINCGVNAHLA